MKKFLIPPLLISFFLVGIVFAHAEDEAASTINLGIENPGTLPTSPFYFLKEWRRAIRLFFTFDRVKKAELELEISNEKAAEAKKVEEENPDDVPAIQRAIENYQHSQERLRVRLEALSDISENPQVERLLEKLEERTEKHEQLFERLSEKFEDHAEVRDISRETKEKLGETLERTLERVGKIREKADEEREEQSEEGEVCIQLYDPVCGNDGKTYSNECHARRAKVEIRQEGECPSPLEPNRNLEEPLKRLEDRLR